MNKVTANGWINTGEAYSEAQDISKGVAFGKFYIYSSKERAAQMSGEKYAPVMASVTIEFEETGELRKE